MPAARRTRESAPSAPTSSLVRSSRPSSRRTLTRCSPTCAGIMRAGLRAADLLDPGRRGERAGAAPLAGGDKRLGLDYADLEAAAAERAGERAADHAAAGDQYVEIVCHKVVRATDER